MNAGEAMSTPVVSVGMKANLEEAAAAMVKAKVGSVLVVDAKGALKGILTERHFLGREAALPFSHEFMPKVFGEWMDSEGLERIFQKARGIKASEVMEPVPTVDEETSLEDVATIMLEKDRRHVVVERDGKPVGVLSRHDLVRLFVKAAQN